MSLSKNRLQEFFLFLIVFLLPFNAFPHLAILGEMGFYLSLYPSVIFILIYFLKFDTVVLPRVESYVVGSFIIIISLSYFFNFENITNNNTKGVSGSSRFITQSMVAIFGFLLFLSISGFCSNKFNFKCNVMSVSKAANAALLLSVAFAVVFQLPLLFGSGYSIGFLEAVYDVIKVDSHVNLRRLESVSGEPSWYGNFIAFSFPFLLLKIKSSKSISKFLSMFVLILTLVVAYFTYSRMVLFTVGTELCVFYLLLSYFEFSKNGRRYFLLVIIPAVSAIVILVIAPAMLESFSFDNSEYLLSNQARFGSNLAAYSMFVDNYLFGVGMGQYAFYFPSYVPDWSLYNQDILSWMSPEIGSKWSPVHNFILRIACELGLLFLLFFLGVYLYLLVVIYKMQKFSIPRRDYLPTIIFVLLVGVFLGLLNIDSFRMLELWVSLGLAFSLIKNYKGCRNV